MVILKDIPFYSICEHHFLPFYGSVHIGYIPSGRVVGASKMGRVVEVLAKRPQLQERLTTQIADTIVEVLQPQGVAVIVQAEHLCMNMRGVKKPGSNIITSATRGLFRRSPLTRSEFLSLVQGK
jgi:GTP cyclohydrolase I